ncbi:hypothetical protein [Pseudonocardia zijingensis]|uniref:Uncharacterized protein n=1 Tax=Pseudonocardia zijingensis TaxID=153376 RepID=A0ABN1N8Y5_9PSEU
MAYTWGAPTPEQRPPPPELRTHPIPITDLLDAIHNPAAADPPTPQPDAQPNELATA